MVRVVDRPEHARSGVVGFGQLGFPIHAEVRPCGIYKEGVARPQEYRSVHQTSSADSDPAHDPNVPERVLNEEATQAEPWKPDEIPKSLVRRAHVVGGDPPALLEHGDAMALLRQAKRRDATAKAASDDNDVVVALHVFLPTQPQGSRSYYHVRTVLLG